MAAWPHSGNSLVMLGASSLPWPPNLTLSHAHFTHIPLFYGPQFGSEGAHRRCAGVVWEFQAWTQGGGLCCCSCCPGTSVSGAPQTPLWRTNVVQGMGQKSECEVRLRVSILVMFCHLLFRQHSSK